MLRFLCEEGGVYIQSGSSFFPVKEYLRLYFVGKFTSLASRIYPKYITNQWGKKMSYDSQNRENKKKTFPVFYPYHRPQGILKKLFLIQLGAP